MALSQWDSIPPQELAQWITNNTKARDAKNGSKGKQTEKLTGQAIEHVRGATGWNSNSGTPICDKIVCYKGRFLLIECKETHDRKLEFSCITPQEHTNLDAVEKTRGLGLVVIRYVIDYCTTAGFAVPYSQWTAAKAAQRYKYFDLHNAPRSFASFSWPGLVLAHDRQERSDLELIIDSFYREKALPL